MLDMSYYVLVYFPTFSADENVNSKIYFRFNLPANITQKTCSARGNGKMFSRGIVSNGDSIVTMAVSMTIVFTK